MRLLIPIVFTLTNCVSHTNNGFENCSDFTLKRYEHPELGATVFVPNNWETEIDFVTGDTISITALDTTHFEKTDELRSAGILQYSSNAEPRQNLEAIEAVFRSNDNVTVVKSGLLTLEEVSAPYFLLYEQTDYPTSNLFIYLQQGDEVINLLLRIDGKIDELNPFCIYYDLISATGKRV